MIDLADRAVLGWSLSRDMTTENTVVEAWKNARKKRRIAQGFLLHSDRGIQYASKQMASIIGMNQWASQSMSRKGNCWDNAVAESFFKSIKYEELNHHRFESFESLYRIIDKYIGWYNTKRIHEGIDYDTPLERELKIRNQFKMPA